MRVTGTMPEVLPVEVNVDTVYVRSNVVRIETPDFVGWEYDEEQFSKDDFIQKLQLEKNALEERLETSETAIDFLLMGGM